jgi:hypothetical protein
MLSDGLFYEDTGPEAASNEKHLASSGFQAGVSDFGVF